MTAYVNVTVFAKHYAKATELLMRAIGSAAVEDFEEALAEAYLAGYEAFGSKANEQMTGVEYVEPHLAEELKASIRAAARRLGVAIER